MKQDLHPAYPPARIHCACGNQFESKSTRGSFNVEICSNCHPFYTGKYKLLDTQGRVERFRKKYENKTGAAAATAAAAAAAAGTEAKPAEGAAAEPAKKAGKAPKAKA